MGLLGFSVVYGLILFFLVCLPYPPTLASVVRQCFEKHNGPRCSKDEELAFDCITRLITDSQDPLDIRTKLTTEIGVWKSNRARFCAEWSKITDPVKLCTGKQTPCKTTNAHSVDLCGRGGVHCNYHNYATCKIKAGMIQGKFLHDIKSDICIETDLNRGLIPYYGPHVQCYGNIADYSVDITFPLDHYLQFCQKFDYNQLKKCIEDKLAPLTSDDLATDKAQFIDAAKSFLHKTNHFCNALSKIDESFLTTCRMKNLLACMKEAFNQTRWKIETSRSGYYIPCISKQYSKCHASIGAIISETLLMGNGFTIISPSFLSLMTLFLFFNPLFTAE